LGRGSIPRTGATQEQHHNAPDQQRARITDQNPSLARVFYIWLLNVASLQETSADLCFTRNTHSAFGSSLASPRRPEATCDSSNGYSHAAAAPPDCLPSHRLIRIIIFITAWRARPAKVMIRQKFVFFRNAISGASIQEKG